MADYLVDQLQWEVHRDLELPLMTLDQECQTGQSVWNILHYRLCPLLGLVLSVRQRGGDRSGVTERQTE